MFLCNEADLLQILELALIPNFAEDRGPLFQGEGENGKRRLEKEKDWGKGKWSVGLYR